MGPRLDRVLAALPALCARLPRPLRWAPHNLVAHPLGEILYHCGCEELSNRLHDATVPQGVPPGEGRG